METLEKRVSNFKALAQSLTTYRMVNPRDGQSREEATAEFLRKGNQVSFPVTVRIQPKDGNPHEESWMPYRIWPSPALESLSTCVRFLEYCLQRENTPGLEEPQVRENPYRDEKIREGVLQLATLLVPSCLINPDRENSPARGDLSTEDAAGGTLLHRSNPKNPSQPIATKRAKLLKGLLDRLEKYETIRLATSEGAPKTSETLSEVLRLQRLFNQELLSSLQAWRTLRDQLTSKTQSLEELGFHEQQSALSSDDDEPGTPLDEAEMAQDYHNQSQWLGAEPANTDFLSNSSKKKLKGNLTVEPDGWLWNDVTDPLEFICQYVGENIQPLIEDKKEGLLFQFQNRLADPKEKEANLLLRPEKKYNPNNWWKLMEALSPEEFTETPGLVEKLAAARFAICLRETNQNYKIDHSRFLQEWEATVTAHLDGTKSQPSRNHALLDTIQRLPEAADWTQQNRDQWLEYLQSLAPGGYENSKAQEKNRQEILQTLNKMLGTLRRSLKENDQPPTKDSLQAMEQTIQRIAVGITKSLSGPTGQTVRRELRYHVRSLRNQAKDRGEKAEEENFRELWKWLVSISGKIIDGSWYKPETQEASQKVIRGMLIDILSKEIGKSTEENIIAMSPEPNPRSSLNISIEFLKSISNDNSIRGFAGFNTIQKKINESTQQMVSLRGKNLGTDLPTKVWAGEKNIENLPNKIRAVEQIISLLEETPKQENPLNYLFKQAEEKFDAILADSQDESQIAGNLAFWEALYNLSDNIRMRKEPPQFQASSLGRNILRTCTSLAREKFTGQQKVPQNIRESMLRGSRKVVLLSNAIAPIALWIQKPMKGKNDTVSHEDVVAGFKEKLKKLVAIERLFKNADNSALENHTRTEEAITVALNLSTLEDLKTFLSDPTQLGKALTWQHRNEKKVLVLNEKNPTVDEPTKRFLQAQETKKKAEPTLPKEEPLEMT